MKWARRSCRAPFQLSAEKAGIRILLPFETMNPSAYISATPFLPYKHSFLSPGAPFNQQPHESHRPHPDKTTTSSYPSRGQGQGRKREVSGGRYHLRLTYFKHRERMGFRQMKGYKERMSMLYLYTYKSTIPVDIESARLSSLVLISLMSGIWSVQ